MITTATRALDADPSGVSITSASRCGALLSKPDAVDVQPFLEEAERDDVVAGNRGRHD